MNPIRLMSLIPIALIATGLLNKKNKRIHTRCMGMAFAFDISLLLYVELTRDAIADFMSNTNDTLLVIHVAFSVTFILLYLFQIATGIMNWKQSRLIPSHKMVALIFVICRLGGFVTSLMLPAGY